MPVLSVPGADLHWQSHGDPALPAVVLAHGRGGNAASWWQQVPVLARTHRVVTFDHRGFARSPVRDGPADPRAFAGDLRAILDAAGIERAALVCQSMGGRTGLGFALEHPQRVSALVLCGTTGGLHDVRIGEILAGFRPKAATVGSLSTLALAPDYPQREPAMAFLYAQIQAFNTAFDYAKPIDLAAPALRVDPARLAGWAVPTLLLGGTEDQIVPPDVLRHLASVIPGAALELLEGVGHSSYFEAAERVNAALLAFLARHP